MLIKVTQKHIDEGRRFDCKCCPIALAIQEAIKDEHVTVSCQYTFIGDEHEKVVRLPDEAIIFISDFDVRVPVKPFEFELDYEQN